MVDGGVRAIAIVMKMGSLGGGEVLLDEEEAKRPQNKHMGIGAPI